MPLKGAQRSQLSKVLLDLFKRDDLARIVSHHLDGDFDHIVPEGKNLRVQVDALIEHYDSSHDGIAKLLDAALAERPGNPELLRLHDVLRTSNNVTASTEGSGEPYPWYRQLLRLVGGGFLVILLGLILAWAEPWQWLPLPETPTPTLTPTAIEIVEAPPPPIEVTDTPIPRVTPTSTKDCPDDRLPLSPDRADIVICDQPWTGRITISGISFPYETDGWLVVYQADRTGPQNEPVLKLKLEPALYYDARVHRYLSHSVINPDVLVWSTDPETGRQHTTMRAFLYRDVPTTPDFLPRTFDYTGDTDEAVPLATRSFVTFELYR